MRWCKEKVEKQRNYFREQRITPTGHFTEFVVRTFYYIYKKCSDAPDGLVRSNVTYSRDLVWTIYTGIYDEPDHMGNKVVDDCVKNLKELNYIGFKRIDDIWYIFIKQQLDFLKPGEHEEYMKKYSIGEDADGK